MYETNKETHTFLVADTVTEIHRYKTAADEDIHWDMCRFRYFCLPFECLLKK